jgi:hypothetical protein
MEQSALWAWGGVTHEGASLAVLKQPAECAIEGVITIATTSAVTVQ